MNRSSRRRIQKLSSSLPLRVAAELGLRVEAKQTSTSGRWVSILGEHRVGGLPCFDVLNINTDGQIDRHHFGTVEAEDTTYDAARDLAKNTARNFYDQLVARLQEKAKPELTEEDQAGLKIINPDGTEENYRIN